MVIGIDPGARADSSGTGIVVLDGHQLLHHTVVRADGPHRHDRVAVVERHVVDVIEALAEAGHVAGDRPLVAVENVNAPGGFAKGRRAPIDPHHLLVTAAVAGVACTWALVCGHVLQLVPPGEHGQAPLQTYPPQLVGPRETTGTTGRLRHARSAFDIALAGRRLHRHPELAR